MGILASMDPARREILIAASFIVALFVIGTSSYTVIEGWNWVDGL